MEIHEQIAIGKQTNYNKFRMKKILLALLALIIITIGLAGASIFLNKTDLWTSILNLTQEEPEEDKVKTSGNYESFIAKGDLLFENGYYTLAINEYTSAAQEKPESADPYNLIGNTYIELGNYEKSLTNFQTALTKSPESADAIIGIAQSYLHLSQFDEARNFLDSSNLAENPEVKYYLALLYAYEGEYDRSEETFQKVTTETEITSEIAENSQKFLDAYKTYEAQQGGQESHLRTLIAEACTEVSQNELAVTILYQVLSQTPTYRDAWILLGYAYLNLAKYEDSASAFEEAIELDTTKPETNYFLALAYFGQDRYEETITYLELALVYGFEPQVQVYQKLAETYFLMEDYELATRNYEKVLELNDTDVNYFIRPIWLNMEKLGNVDQALELAQWAISSHPDSAMSYNLMGWAMISAQDYEEARTYLESALSMDENLAAGYLNLGTLDEIEGDLESAKVNYKKAYTLDQNDSVGALAAEKYNNLLNQ